MKRSIAILGIAFLALLGIPGCGGHEGGVVDIPLSENPYQVSEQEQRSMNSGIVDTAALTDEEVAALEEAKKKEAEQAEAER